MHSRTHHRGTRRLAMSAIVTLAICGCQGTGAVPARALFAEIRPGMSCAQVEALLGPPLVRHSTVTPPRVGDDEAWYLPPPAIGLLDAPWGPGTIRVVYSADNRVRAKELSPQWRDAQDTSSGAGG